MDESRFVSIVHRAGEEFDELIETFEDLRAVGCQILTIGQYLRPTEDHAPMARYYHPGEFATLKRAAYSTGRSSSSQANSAAT